MVAPAHRQEIAHPRAMTLPTIRVAIDYRVRLEPARPYPGCKFSIRDVQLSRPATVAVLHRAAIEARAAINTDVQCFVDLNSVFVCDYLNANEIAIRSWNGRMATAIRSGFSSSH